MKHSDWIAAAGSIGVMACWVAFWVVFMLRKKPPEAQESKREPASYWGIALQSVGYFLVWVLQRRPFSPIVRMPKAAEITLSALSIAIAALSVWLCGTAVRTLGKQWAYRARVIEGHELITQGPYSLVRNPIYLGMFGLLVATGLAISVWPVLIAASVIFLIGNEIRIRSEEKLLREAFGPSFDEYARHTPAFVPKLF